MALNAAFKNPKLSLSRTHGQGPVAPSRRLRPETHGPNKGHPGAAGSDGPPARTKGRSISLAERKTKDGRILSMSLNIKNEDAERLARQLAAATGESVTRAVTVAVRERLDRVRREDEGAVADRAAQMREIAKDAASRWVEPYRSAEHGDLLYDEAGLPR